MSLKKGVVNSAFHAQTPRAPPYWKSAKNFVGVKADKRMGEGLALSWAEDMGIKKKDLRETYQMLIEAETEEADCFLHLVSHQCFPYVRVLIGNLRQLEDSCTLQGTFRHWTARNLGLLEHQQWLPYLDQNQIKSN